MSEPVEKVACARCGVAILASTAEKTGGLCIPCKNGSRESIETSKRLRVEERERQAREELARAPLEALRKAGKNLQFREFIHLQDPPYEIFRMALKMVFDQGDASNQQHLERLSDECRVIYLLGCFSGEIYNGGFDQFFTNSSGNHALEVLEGLGTVGATNAGNLLRQALRWFPDSSPATDRERRWQQYQAFSRLTAYQEEMDALDKAFYEDQDNLDQLISAYVDQHQNAFIAR